MTCIISGQGGNFGFSIVVPVLEQSLSQTGSSFDSADLPGAPLHL